MSDFYDRMASLYHLIYPDWNESIDRQAGQLTSIIRERWGPECRTVLDVSCGIGTQALGLAQRGFLVTASDLSVGAISMQDAWDTLAACVICFRLLHDDSLSE